MIFNNAYLTIINFEVFFRSVEMQMEKDQAESLLESFNNPRI